MSYDTRTKQYISRPGSFMIGARTNMAHSVMKLDHRIPWNLLQSALNKVLAGEADVKVVNALMKLSPSPSVEKSRILKNFGTAVNELKPGREPNTTQMEALEAVENEIFSLPVNLALGLNERADDPGGDCLDFTPDDVDHSGTPQTTAVGLAHKVREKLFGQLSQAKIDAGAVDAVVTELISTVSLAALSSATPANFEKWHPGPPAPSAGGAQRTKPAYRYWLNPTTGEALTADDIQKMLKQVTERAKKAK